MIIKSEYNLNIRSVEEFARILVPEATKKTIEVSFIENDSFIEVEIGIDGASKTMKYKNINKFIEDQKLTMVKIALLIFYSKSYSWGALMGVRPTKIVRRFLELGLNFSEIRDILRDFYLVKESKIDLLIEVVEKELKFLDNNYINLYVGIPFCTTKCSYCSFASYEVGGGVGKYYDGFVATLLKEIDLLSEFLKRYDKKVSSIYFGGGTPSTLKENDLEMILKSLTSKIDMENVIEFTFEGGREDSLNEEKLNIIKKYGINRVSLNPQTFNTSTLKRVNRNFNRKNFDYLYKKIKELGLILNMDLIVGLPGENTEDILYSLDEIKKFDIDNLTVHSLAFKRASNLFKGDKERVDIDRERIEEEIKNIIFQKDMKPYYMYRQKNIIEWGENIGYSRDGAESIFNMEMIEENQNTIGLGSGAISKVILKESNKNDFIKRIINPKDPALYIKEMEERSRVKFDFFEKEMKGGIIESK